MPKAELLVRVKEIVSGGIREVVIWLLDEPLPGCSHRLKYRLYFGLAGGTCLVRYDNERDKGDHRHITGREESYNFTSVENLLDDFENDVRRLS
ncbi:MAG: toxin-antitoxin system TumE family protein [Desulfuromonadaceae bacterium]